VTVPSNTNATEHPASPWSPPRSPCGTPSTFNVRPTISPPTVKSLTMNYSNTFPRSAGNTSTSPATTTGPETPPSPSQPNTDPSENQHALNVRFFPFSAVTRTSQRRHQKTGRERWPRWRTTPHRQAPHLADQQPWRRHPRFTSHPPAARTLSSSTRRATKRRPTRSSLDPTRHREPRRRRNRSSPDLPATTTLTNPGTAIDSAAGRSDGAAKS
jgi:hypothetical protein